MKQHGFRPVTAAAQGLWLLNHSGTDIHYVADMLISAVSACKLIPGQLLLQQEQQQVQALLDRLQAS